MIVRSIHRSRKKHERQKEKTNFISFLSYPENIQTSAGIAFLASSRDIVSVESVVASGRCGDVDLLLFDDTVLYFVVVLAVDAFLSILVFGSTGSSVKRGNGKLLYTITVTSAVTTNSKRYQQYGPCQMNMISYDFSL